MNNEHDAGPVMYVSRMDAFLNRWFNTYEEARAVLESDGGYLFAYRHQYIGFDWVQPTDRNAWERLELKREVAS